MDEDTSILEKARKRWKSVKECSFEKNVRDGSSLDFFTGKDQGWDADGARSKLEDEGRPALTLNKVHPIVRLITGARPKTETSFMPVEGGDLKTAQVFEACSDHIDRFNRWEFLSNDIFLNMIVNKGAVIELKPHYDVDPMGEIELCLGDRHDWWFDPNSKQKDRRDGEYAFNAKRVSTEEAIRMFPKSKGLIENLALGNDENQSGSSSSDHGDDYADDTKGDFYDNIEKKLTIVYYWYKEYEKATKIIDLSNGDVIDSTKKQEEVEEKLDNMLEGDRFKVMSNDFTKVRYLVFSYDVELERGDSPWERKDGKNSILSSEIPAICFEPDRLFAGTRQEILDFIEGLKDPQKFYNKLSSSVLHIIGTTANSGWEYEDGALTPEAEENLKQYGSKAGYNIKWNPNTLAENRRQKIQPSSPPVGQIEYADRLASALLSISGVESLVSTETLGKDASGKAIDLKQRQGGNIISWIYDTFDFYMYLLSEFKRDAIQVLFDYEKVIRIKGTGNKYVTINENVYDEQGEIIKVLNDPTVGKYDLAITRKEIMPTIRLERFRHFSELVKGGALPLPPEVMLKMVLHMMDDPELKEMVETEFGDYAKIAQQGAMAQGQPGAGGPPKSPAPPPQPMQ